LRNINLKKAIHFEVCFASADPNVDLTLCKRFKGPGDPPQRVQLLRHHSHWCDL
jgi:hypothetical protein